MRLTSIRARNIEPIKVLEIDGLSDVVVIAGPNGVGKTRFINSLLGFLQNLNADPNFSVTIEATSAAELTTWATKTLSTSNPGHLQHLRTTLQQQRQRGKWTSSILHFESNRAITRIEPYGFNWRSSDPFVELLGWNYGYQSLVNRFSDTMQSIFRMVRSRTEAIATAAVELIKQHQLTAQNAKTSPTQITLDYSPFPDPLESFKAAFSQLLAPKKLLDADPAEQQLRYSIDGKQFPITELSSGEREVVNIVFDFLLRRPSDCIVIFDEPELHLHPELSYKLIQTLRSAGERNQFILCTHSADIITASLQNSVVFIAPPSNPAVNQAIMVRENDETHQALRLLGQSIGIVSLGRKLVLIEGDQTSLDKQAYGAILRDKYPNLVPVPCGSKHLIRSFSSLQKSVLDKALWGVDFFMLCDRDALPPSAAPNDPESASGGRLRVLQRSHMENYFLDENCIAKVMEPIEPLGSQYRDPARIKAILKGIAQDMLSYAVSLIVSAHYRERAGNVDIMPNDCHGKSETDLVALINERTLEETRRISIDLEPGSVAAFTRKIMTRLSESLAHDTAVWKAEIPGKRIVAKFCSMIGLDQGRFKYAYINAAKTMDPDPFKEIVDIFEGFDKFVHK